MRSLLCKDTLLGERDAFREGIDAQKSEMQL